MQEPVSEFISAENLHSNLHVIFTDFGEEKITESSHLEKVFLVSDGVGRDNISDFTTSLIKDYLCLYTEAFAASYLPADAIREVWVERAHFNYKTQSWVRAKYRLPWVNDDFVILTCQRVFPPHGDRVRPRFEGRTDET